MHNSDDLKRRCYQAILQHQHLYLVDQYIAELVAELGCDPFENELFAVPEEHLVKLLSYQARIDRLIQQDPEVPQSVPRESAPTEPVKPMLVVVPSVSTETPPKKAPKAAKKGKAPSKLN